MIFTGGVDCCYFCFKQKTAYEMRISDWSSDVCSSDLLVAMTSIKSKIGGGGGGTKYSEIEPAEPIKGPRHNIDLGELLDAVKKLMALKGAIDTGKTLLGGIDGVRQTQAEYQQMVQAKNRAQANRKRGE